MAFFRTFLLLSFGLTLQKKLKILILWVPNPKIPMEFRHKPNPYPNFGSGTTLGYPNFGYPILALVTCSGSSLKPEPGFSRIRQKNDLLAPGDSQGRVVAAAEIVSVPVGLVALKCFELPFLL